MSAPLLIEEAPPWVADLAPKARLPNLSSPFTDEGYISVKAECEISDDLLTFIGHDDYVGQSSMDPPVNTAVQAAPMSEFAPLRALCEKWMPAILEKLFSELSPEPYQPYNNVSRIGWPINTFVDDKAFVVQQFLKSYGQGDLVYLPGFVTKGGRRQVEPLSKVRSYLAIDGRDSSVIEVDIDRREYPMDFLNSGLKRYPVRKRDVFSYPVYNLLTQVVDTQLHAVFGDYPTWHHDMERKDAPEHWEYLTFDVAHFERSLWVVGDYLGELVGGVYGEVKRAFYRETPFICKAYKGKKVYLVRPNLDAGFAPQLGSGVSDVALSGKLAMAVVYCEYFEDQEGLHGVDAINALFSGGTTRVEVNNFGDDNLLISRMGDRAALERCAEFVGRYFPITIEDKEVFLGRHLSRKRKRWELPMLSFIKHTWLRERSPRPPFTRYPWYATMMRIEVYKKNAPPEFADLLARQDQLLSLHGTRSSIILERGADEEQRLRADAPRAWDLLNDDDLAFVVFSEKDDYLLSPKLKVQLGDYLGVSGFLPSLCRSIIKGSIAQTWQNKLKW